SLPDFRGLGVDAHARFVARLWEELREGPLASDHAPRAIAQLDNTQGDIDTLQGRIAAIRSWSYITQRPDWVLAREEMAARARAVEQRLSDALHARLTERFVNRRTAVLMRRLGGDAGLLPVRLDGDAVMVEDETIGALTGFQFRVDPKARHGDHKLLLAAADRHLPALMAQRAQALTAAIAEKGDAGLVLAGGKLRWHGEALARVSRGRSLAAPGLAPLPLLDRLEAGVRARLVEALEEWLAARMKPLAPLGRIEEASLASESGPELRALLIRLIEGGGMIAREGSGIERLSKAQRDRLRRLQVRVGALDIFVPGMLRPVALHRWAEASGIENAPILPKMTQIAEPVARETPMGYRRLGAQALRIDMAEALLRAAHDTRMLARGRPFRLDPAEALRMGLSTRAYAHVLRLGGFKPLMPRALAEGMAGPPAPLLWRWQPPRPERAAPSGGPAAPVEGNPFAALAQLVA
ncbi:MAG TPA: helicase, partial [Novosphingobium sp.]|nr:helicase [Novosphingobium sp.]